MGSAALARQTERISRPILFSAPMVLALLAGRKTQTRRVVKPVRGYEHNNVCRPDMAADPWAVWWHGQSERVGCLQSCPYGKPGDLLWVRETFYCDHFEYPKAPIAEMQPLLDYRATHDCATWEAGCPCRDETGRSSWRPSIHMPRWASRITLEVESVRVERLQTITEEDARAEGVEPCGGFMATSGCWTNYGSDGPSFSTARESFASLWRSINGPESWDANPWVWVVGFSLAEVKR